jgi:hypothetical protein
VTAVIEEARQQRFERELRRCKTDKQREVFIRLHENGETPWVATRTGKRVVAAFKKYVTSADPQAIDKGLYHWSIYDGPGEIAHFDINGFRSVYYHPALYLELLLLPWLKGNPRIPNVYVYVDGMTSVEIKDQIKELAVQWRHRVNELFAQKRRREELAEAEAIAAKYDMKLVPKEGDA